MEEEDLNIESDNEDNHTHENNYEYIDPKTDITTDIIHHSNNANRRFCKNINKLRLSANDEIIIAFNSYITKQSIFSQEETNFLRIELKSLVSRIIHNQYSILLPIFFIEAYGIKKRIAFSLCFKKSFAEEIYVKNACIKIRNNYISSLCELLEIVESDITWEYYIRGFMIIVRSAIINNGSYVKYAPINEDNFFISNGNTSFYNLFKEIKYHSYTIIAIGIKHNKLNAYKMDVLFDKHITLLLDVLEKESILSKDIINIITNTYLSNVYRGDKSSKPLEEAYNLEYNIYQSSKDVEKVSIINSHFNY